MRVLSVVHGFPPRASGGSEVYAHDLARVLVRDHGAEVFVLTREADPSRDEYATRRETTDGIELLWINNTFRAVTSFEQSYTNPEIRAIAAEWMDEVRPDIAHVHHLTCLSTGILAELARRRIPIVFTIHDFWLICHRGQLLDLDFRRCDGPWDGCASCIGPAAGAGPALFRAAGLVRAVGQHLPPAPRRLMDAAARSTATLTSPASDGERATRERLRHMQEVCSAVDLFLAPSQTVRDQFLRFGVAPERMRMHEYGIDVSSFAAARANAIRHDGPLRIGFLGSLMISKGAHLLLEAFQALPAGSATLYVFGEPVAYHGDDSYSSRIEPLLAIPGVHRMGPIAHDRVPEALASLDVLVAPSIWLENSPLVIREALAAGVPVVTSNLGGMAEMVRHGENGLLFEAGSVDALRTQLRRLLDEPDLLSRLRAAIRPPRSVEDDAAATFGIYESLIRRSGTNKPSRLAAVVLNYRTPQLAIRAAESLRRSRRAIDDLIVVDNGSEDGSEEQLRRALPQATVLQTGRNLGFPGGCNAGIREALARGADLVLLVNSDIEVAPATVERLEQALAADEGLGLAGPVILSSADRTRIDSRGMSFSRATGRMRHPDHGSVFEPQRLAAVQSVDGLMGCALLVKRAVFDRIGLLDEEYFFSFEDLDFCLRAREAGFGAACVRDAVAYHDGAASIGPDSPRRLYFATRNHLRLASRVAPVNPLLSLLRAANIVALTTAHALLRRRYPLREGLRSIALGAWDYFAGRGRQGRHGFTAKRAEGAKIRKG